MKRFLFMMAIVALFPLAMDAQLSNRTRLFLQTHKTDTQLSEQVPSLSKIKTKTMSTTAGTTESVQCFISLKEWSLSKLEAEGAVINSKYKNMVLATVPVDKIESIAKKQCVKQIDVEKRVRLLTDVARTKTYAEDVQTLSSAAQAAGLTQAYDGTGVVLGIIDDGIEFNHTAFKDASGNTRVKAVYMPNATSANGGSTVTIDGSTLPGYQYTTSSQIGNLTTDDTEASHGTHTTGCAGGTRITTTGLSSNTTYSGMAPGVDLVLCGCGEELTDAAISNSAKYIANYAKTHNQPCIISISLGATTGPHDGTSSLCRVYDEIAEEYGCIIFLAAGNEADMNCYLTKTLSSSSDYLATQIAPTSSFASNYGSSYYCVGGSDIWNSTSDELQVQFIVYQGTSAVYTSSKMSSGTISASTLSSYFTSITNGKIQVSGGVDSNNGRYNLYVSVYLGTAKSSSKLAMIVYGKAGNVITMWNDANYSQYSSGTVGTYSLTAGNGTNSICDDVTGKKTISVGAWADRLSIPYNYGSKTGTMSNDSYSEQDIAYFSSYGTDFNGVQHPFVASPGHSVISSVNRYDTESITFSESAYRKSLGSNTYDYWMYMSGTSMATPCAAGVVALWLQADPTLTVDDVKNIITETATHDSYTDGSNKIKFGAGKINALEGIKYILNSSTDPKITADPTTLSFTDAYVGETYTKTVSVTGTNLEGNITTSVSGTGFTIDKTSIAQTNGSASTTITVTYKPTAAGTQTGTITLKSANADDITITLTGTAQAKVPTITASKSSLDFTAGLNASQSNTFSVQTKFLTENVKVTLSDANGVFTVTPTSIDKSAAEESSVDVTVTFLSANEGTFTGTVTLTSSGAETVTVNLSATANDGGTASDAYLNIAKYATIDDAGWRTALVNNLYKYTEYEDDEVAWLTLPIYGAFVGAKYSTTSSTFGSGSPQKWIETNITSTSGNPYTGTTWTYTPTSTNPYYGSSTYFTSANARALGNNSSISTTARTVTFYVTNTNAVKLYGRTANRSVSSYPTTLTIYECTVNSNGTLTAATTATKSASHSSNNAATNISCTGLDVTKVYKVVASVTRGYLYEIGFQTPLEVAKIPEIAADPTSLEFSAPVGTTAQKTFNVKGKNLTGNIIATLTDANGVYALDANSISVSDATNGKDVTVTFKPTTAGTFTGTITISSDGATSVTVQLNATGLQPTIIAGPEELTFDGTVGTPVTATFDVLAESLADVVTATLTDENGVFTLDQTTISVADAEEGKTVTVTFNPTAKGTYTGTVTLTSPNADPVIVDLKGTATPAYFDVTISSYGIGTFYLDFPVEIPYSTYDPDLLGIYYAYDIANGEVKMARLSQYIPANTGVIVQGNSGTYRFPKTTATIPDLKYDNYLSGVTEATNVTDITAEAPTGYAVYTLGLGPSSYIGFYRYSGKTIRANSAYILYDTSAFSSAKSLNIVINDEVTGIRNLSEANLSDDTWYTLQGIKLDGKPTQSGIYIHNNQKTTIK